MYYLQMESRSEIHFSKKFLAANCETKFINLCNDMRINDQIVK